MAAVLHEDRLIEAVGGIEIGARLEATPAADRKGPPGAEADDEERRAWRARNRVGISPADPPRSTSSAFAAGPPRALSTIFRYSNTCKTPATLDAIRASMKRILVGIKRVVTTTCASA